MDRPNVPFRCRFRLRTLLVAVPALAWLIARAVSEPVAEVEAWILIHEQRSAAGNEASDSPAKSRGPEREKYAASLKSRSLLTRSLQPREISALPIIQRQTDAAAWLRNELRVDFRDDSNLVRISLRGHDADQLSKVLHSIAATYSRTLRRSHGDATRLPIGPELLDRKGSK